MPKGKRKGISHDLKTLEDLDRAINHAELNARVNRGKLPQGKRTNGHTIAEEVRCSQVTKKDIAKRHGISEYEVTKIAKQYGIEPKKRK